VVLALGGRDHDQRVFVEPERLRQHRRRHLDDVVARQFPDDLVWGGRDRGQAVRQLGAPARLDRIGQTVDHLIEQLDLLERIVLGADEEKVGDTAQRLEPLAAGAVSDRVVEFRQHGLPHAHCRCPQTILPSLYVFPLKTLCLRE
jgi:hypothetical protein